MSKAIVRETEEHHYDVIVVGTGMGGATAGYRLAQQGKKVLFCESGLAATLKGAYPEYLTRTKISSPERLEVLSRAGRYTQTVMDIAKRQSFIPFVGAGRGGSSALYGMVLERLTPEDFSPRAQHGQAGQSMLPERWPISYEELEPYYQQAEALYRVKPNAALDDAHEELLESMEARGLKPYRLPLARDLEAECQSCQGYLCAKPCKNDADRICLNVAVEKYSASVLEGCHVTRVVANKTSVTGIEVTHEGKHCLLTADTYILAAGALETPRLLLNSANDIWPHGVANGSGMVGRTLMRHVIDLVLVKPKSKLRFDPSKKAIGTRKFYGAPHNLGSVQSFGALPPESMILESMFDDLHYSPFARLLPMIKVFSPIIRYFVRQLRQKHVILATIMEDLPYYTNRIAVAADGMLEIHYQTHSYERARIKQFRALVKEMLSEYRVKLLKQADNNQRIAHACGTCRFGDDPKTSVLNRFNRTHELNNLYVVDGSFFPSSGGTNPSLTIAANALRVADHIGAESTGS